MGTASDRRPRPLSGSSRTARIPQSHHPRGLVERLAGRIVQRPAEPLILAVARASAPGRSVRPRRSGRRAGSAARPAPPASWRRRGPPDGSRPAAAARAQNESAFAVFTPTSSAPASPGPRVTATTSMAHQSAPRLRERPLDDRPNRSQVQPRGRLGHNRRRFPGGQSPARRPRSTRSTGRPRRSPRPSRRTRFRSQVRAPSQNCSVQTPATR